MTKRMQRFVATVAFSGNLDPDPDAAEKELIAAGYEVVRMPEERRPMLWHPRDYFFEVFKHYPSGATACTMMDTLNELVRPYGADADDCGPVDENYVPFKTRYAQVPSRNAQTQGD